VKYLLDLPEGANAQFNINGELCSVDTIEIAGRVRDKLFHGVPFEATDLSVAARPAFTLYTDQPQVLADSLAYSCEMEISKWALGTSKGLPSS
jgi:hypothetical protein